MPGRYIAAAAAAAISAVLAAAGGNGPAADAGSALAAGSHGNYFVCTTCLLRMRFSFLQPMHGVFTGTGIAKAFYVAVKTTPLSSLWWFANACYSRSRAKHDGLMSCDILVGHDVSLRFDCAMRSPRRRLCPAMLCDFVAPCSHFETFCAQRRGVRFANRVRHGGRWAS